MVISAVQLKIFEFNISIWETMDGSTEEGSWIIKPLCILIQEGQGGK